MSEPVHSIGVDLGTTHCAMAHVDRDLSEGEDVALGSVKVKQSVAPGEVESRFLLPSFLYLPHPQELPAGASALPWNPTPRHIVGAMARKLGSQTPDRLVASAKSWLGHHGVDRRAAILPQHAADEVAKVSPLEASTEYLRHLRHAWDALHPRDPFVEQDITLTVPASFDPSARELTAEAARAAGYQRLTLLEEPQAALYSWIHEQGEDWREQLSVGDVILVVDVGGGTTDFSLIATEESEGSLQLRRVAVGDHILLGGDNMDLALAYTVKGKVEANGASLEPWQIQGLTQACRSAKEQLLSGDAESVPVVVPSRGRKLVGGTLRAELTRADVERVVLEGFFPKVERDAEPTSRRRGALTDFGLPYAQDAAVTRHLAAFLARQREAAARPTAVLFTGGVLNAPAIA
ncbi:MAG: Hsp70 family protein, partial [Myxococcota bacterium]